jgi:ornithine cyclodeaminase
MLFLEEHHIKEAGINWHQTIEVIEETVKCLEQKDFSQPVKPYLRYRDAKNRIIAMPAFVGGSINMAGIKWIASFPGNIEKGIPRAHSVVILNDAETGQPLGIINTALLSIIRTASVSGLIVKYFEKVRNLAAVNIGIAGFGPIGRHHLTMCLSVLGKKINKIKIFDIRKITSLPVDNSGQIEIVNSWEEAYTTADIFITCTVADAPYIDKPPKEGSLHLNVSLRDYKTNVYDWFKDSIIVDDWNEVCREKTDIEMMHLEKGLSEENTKTITDVVCRHCMHDYPAAMPVMFNPMGMAVFDIAVGCFYYRLKMAELNGKYALEELR